MIPKSILIVLNFRVFFDGELDEHPRSASPRHNRKFGEIAPVKVVPKFLKFLKNSLNWVFIPIVSIESI